MALSDVRERIKSDLVIVGTLYDSQIDDAIRSALRQLRRRKFWFLETSDTLTLDETLNTVDLPDDFGNSGAFELIAGGNRYSHGRGFDFISFEELRAKYWNTEPIDTGQPRACAVSGSTLYFSHLADQDYTIPLVYYKQDESLPQANDDSVWFDDGYDVVRSLGMLIFKRESQHYMPSEEDGAQYERYMAALSRQHEQFEGSR